MKILTDFGMAYRLSDSAYRRFLRDVAADKAEGTLSDYGKCLGYVVNVTDINPEEAQDKLDELGAKTTERNIR